jgi:chemotaxis protein histidine kinase CheA
MNAVVILDELELTPSLIADFFECMEENLLSIQDSLLTLERSQSLDDVNGVFRHLHSFKGNCAMIGAQSVVDILHRLEEVLDRIRKCEIPLSDRVSDLVSVTCSQAEYLLRTLIADGVTDDNKLITLADQLDLLVLAPAPCFVETLECALSRIGGQAVTGAPVKPNPALTLKPDHRALFQTLAEKIDGLSIYRRERSREELTLALALNDMLDKPASPQQLEAAALVHDLGMGFVPQTILEKTTGLTNHETKLLQEHVKLGSQLLINLGGWDEAATIVLQHHERVDGQGYPSGLKAEQIHPGARILAIVDTFCSITSERADRSYKRSLLSAVSEVNANSGTQFDSAYVEAFNSVVRQQFVSRKPPEAQI